MLTEKLNPLNLRTVIQGDDLPFPKSWDEIKAEVVQWSFESGYAIKPKDVIDYLEQRYLPPFQRGDSSMKEDSLD